MDGALVMNYLIDYRACACLLILALACLACSPKGEPLNSECPPILDTVETLLTQAYEGKNYVVVKRITGWHDKTVIIQLFDQSPRLGQCREDLVTPVFEDSIEQDKPLLKLKADIVNNDYSFVYGNDDATPAPFTLELSR